MIISGVEMPSPLMTKKNCKSSPVDDVDVEERNDKPDWEKNESRPLFLTHMSFIEMFLE